MIKFEDILYHIYNKANFNKNLGQNYLINKNISLKMISILDIKKNDLVFEAGSGYGSISFFLLKCLCKKITLNDIDKKSIFFLNEICPKKENINIDIIKDSFLNVDVSNYTKIISSIPYYIATKTLEYFLTNGINTKKYVFLVQKDFLKRLKSNAGSKNYCPLSIIIKNFFILREEFNVANNFFYPKPHVSSVVFSIELKKDIFLDRKKYLFFLKKMFFNRRKTIYKNLLFYLHNNKEQTLKILKKNNLSILLRPEQINNNVYLDIFKMINTKN